MFKIFFMLLPQIRCCFFLNFFYASSSHGRGGPLSAYAHVCYIKEIRSSLMQLQMGMNSRLSLHFIHTIRKNLFKNIHKAIKLTCLLLVYLILKKHFYLYSRGKQNLAPVRFEPTPPKRLVPLPHPLH